MMDACGFDGHTWSFCQRRPLKITLSRGTGDETLKATERKISSKKPSMLTYTELGLYFSNHQVFLLLYRP